jgi:predicted dehydrogenase
MAPIRVGFLGLSKDSWGSIAHLPYLKSSPSYEIVAVCNSSVKSSNEAIKNFGLNESTKAYGNPQGLLAVLLVLWFFLGSRENRTQ